MSQSQRNYFRLEPLQEEFNFVQNDDFFKSRRFRLLQYRNRGILEFKNLRMVPMYDKDIFSDIFKVCTLFSNFEDKELDVDSLMCCNKTTTTCKALLLINAEVW